MAERVVHKEYVRGEVAFGGDGDGQVVPSRMVVASRNLETGEIAVEVKVSGEVVQRIEFDDWDVARVEAVRLLLGVGLSGGPGERE